MCAPRSIIPSCAAVSLLFAVAPAAQDLAPIPDPDGRLEPELRARLALADPRADAAWPAERLYPLVNGRLRALGEWLQDGGAGPLPFELDEAFAAGPLRPALATVFESDRFVVARPVVDERATVEPSHDLVALLHALVDGLAPTPGEPVSLARSHLQTFGVQLDEGSLRASSHVRFATLADDVAVEVRAVWHTRWMDDGEGAFRLRGIEVEDYEEVRASAAPLFEDRTEALLGSGPLWREQLARGIDYWRARLDTRLGLPLLAHPAGIAIGDVDADGLEDVFVCQPGGLPNRLLLHRDDGTVLDVSARAGLDHLDFTRAALFVDFDADGDDDLVTVMGASIVFFENDGKARFEARGSYEVGNATSLAAADFDGDGDVDLYVCAYFVPYEDAGAGGAVPMPYHDARNGQRNVLYANDGEWRFRDATGPAGLDVGNSRFSFAASWEDYDNDGDQDLYVANDFGANNLYRNDHGVFVDVAREAGVQDVAAGMGVSWADANADGWMDLYVSNMFSFAGNRMTGLSEFMPGADPTVRAAFRRHASGNTLFLNRGDGTFDEVAHELGVAQAHWSWGAVWLDFDNSGLPDLVVPNGNLTAEREDEL